MPSGATRYFNGVVSRFSQGARSPQGTQYHAEVVPSHWFLTRNADSRIFQQLSVPDIVSRILAATQAQSSFQLTDTHFARNYCVQYRESDFNFASRLMEDEGIFYFFQHSAGHHTLVAADSPQAQPALGTFVFDRTGGNTQDRIFDWLKAQELRAGLVTLADFEFELPGAPIEATATIPDSVQAGQVTHILKLAGNDHLELYDYPAGWAQRFDGVDPRGGDQSGSLRNIFPAAQQTASIRMGAEAERSVVITGGSTAAAFSPGNTFSMQGHFNGDGSYLLTEVTHTATPLGTGFEYTNEFTCIPAGVPFRPVRSTPKPVLPGTQTAVVVGPAGDEIFTDKYGRVKVQFHWDREGKNDENSSCWIRVAQPIGGTGGGFFWLPELGDEVIVAFEEGDPDRPLIVGRVYNASDAPRRPPP